MANGTKVAILHCSADAESEFSRLLLLELLLLICLTLDVVYYTQTIDQVMLIEKDFFAPNIAGDLGSSLESAQELQTKLQNFEPIAKVEQNMRTMLAAMTMP